MKATELRIGNYVHESLAIVSQVLKLESMAIHLVEAPYNNEGGKQITKHFPSDVKPVLLTEEWLINLGFIKEECFFYKNGVAIEDDFTLENFGEINLEYVHQLQNLYFSLTGEELKASAEKK